ncbi:poly(ADP-ribose) glycohydrolase [Echeneis naucrates]|uniref:poly(ADP-ribose) glycohydrolase n=1 Tax=Echeneis naucrates TaxID=173247 RepID=A0A665VDF7_ECHNA|nr:poly(ADP-ribose) glycohydrolase-like [Echeneis naucrates]
MAGPHEHRNDSSQMKNILQPNQDFGGQRDRLNSGGHNSNADPFLGPAGPGHDGSRPEREQDSSSCSQFSDLKKLTSQSSKLRSLTFSKIHTVLIDVPTFNKEGRIKPVEGNRFWGADHVKMPFSQCNEIGKPSGIFKPTWTTRPKWESIDKQLKSLARMKQVSVKEVEEAIIKINPKYKDKWTFDALASFVKCIPKEENYFPVLFPKIAALAVRLPELVRKGIPMLKSGKTAAITLSQVQISCLLANAFFCTFPHRNMLKPGSEYHSYPSINFSSLFWKWSERKKEKLRAIMHYFKVVTDKDNKLDGLVTFERRCLENTDMPDWKSSQEKLNKLHIRSDGSIETEGAGMLQVDFASSLIGGGILGSGLVQEEILFLLNPELIVSRLFTEKLGDNECLIITGTQKFSMYSGFGDSFEWAGPYEDHLERDEWCRRKRQILAIDALNFKDGKEQFKMDCITRELNKAYCGFFGRDDGDPDIATGKWGCGAFHGDPQLKALIQLMAAAKAKRGLAFFTFGDEDLQQDLERIHHLLVSEGVTVEKLYRLLEKFCTTTRLHAVSQMSLFDFIRREVRPSRSQL